MTKAIVVPFTHAGIELQCLVLPDGRRKIAISQIADVDLVPRKRSLKQLQQLTGLVLPSHEKVKSELNSKAVNAIDLSDYRKIVRWADKQGNELAARIIDASTEFTIDQAIDVALGIKKTNEQGAKEYEELVESKRARRSLTDCFKIVYAETGCYPSYGKHTLLTYRAIGLEDKYKDWLKKYSKAQRQQFTFRHHYLSMDERILISKAEANIEFMVMKLSMEVEEAIAKL